MEIQRAPEHAQIVSLLQANGLPTADIDGLDLQHFLYIGDKDNPTGIIGLEILGQYGLLRSLVVVDEVQGQGYGRALVTKLEELAANEKLKRLYLLTETAQPFFANLNYIDVERADAPAEIRQTKEFSGLCSESAVLMLKVLDNKYE